MNTIDKTTQWNFNFLLGLIRVNVHSYAPPTKSNNNNKCGKRQSTNRPFSLPNRSPPHSAITVIGSTVGSLALTQIDIRVSLATAFRRQSEIIITSQLNLGNVCDYLCKCRCIKLSRNTTKTTYNKAVLMSFKSPFALKEVEKNVKNVFFKRAKESLWLM